MVLSMRLSWRLQAFQALSMQATHVQCTYATKRTDQPQGHTYTFTLDDAIRAGLHASEFYQRWPKAMLAARAMTGLCREQYPELVGAVYDPTEILGTMCSDHQLDATSHHITEAQEFERYEGEYL